jgi:hypothetical protein
VGDPAALFTLTGSFAATFRKAPTSPFTAPNDSVKSKTNSAIAPEKPSDGTPHNNDSVHSKTKPCSNDR